jgi:hypothetical protein
VIALLNRILAGEKSRRRLSVSAPWLVILLAAFFRLWNLGYPNKLVFDETYYVKEHRVRKGLAPRRQRGL